MGPDRNLGPEDGGCSDRAQGGIQQGQACVRDGSPQDHVESPAATVSFLQPLGCLVGPYLPQL